MNEVVQVFEHQILRVGENGLTRRAFEALVRFNQRHDDQLFVVRHNSLKFTSHVGVLQVGDLTIEILPKADRHEPGGEAKWHLALIDMLRDCGYLKLAAASTASLYLRRGSLFDLYMEAFLTDVERLLHEGLVRKYRTSEGNVTALKGRLIFSRDLTCNLIHRERFFTAHQAYDRNNVFNQILYAAVIIVAQTARSEGLRHRARSILSWMDGVDSVRITESGFASLRWDRNTERYRSAINLARLVILNYQPDVRAGGCDVLAILFDMNELFEEYVLSQLKRGAASVPGRIQVRGQKSEHFWRSQGTVKSIRPDVLVTLVDDMGQSETVVLDTKWKIPKTYAPDDGDLKQMYVYNLQFGAKRSFLVYPCVSDHSDVVGNFRPPADDGGYQHGCGMWFAELFENGRLKKQLGTELLLRLRAA